jgi:WD40 repeat protein
MIDYDVAERENTTHVPPKRLVTLIQQAIAYQIQTSRYQLNTKPKVTTLLTDYTTIVVPNSLKSSFKGHTDKVKCVLFVGDNGVLLATGSSDNSVRLWETESGQCLSTMTGHSSRIWDLTSTKDGRFLASASGDSTIKVILIHSRFGM